jgi:hypothetical protein
VKSTTTSFIVAPAGILDILKLRKACNERSLLSSPTYMYLGVTWPVSRTYPLSATIGVNVTVYSAGTGGGAAVTRTPMVRLDSPYALAAVNV